MMTPQQFEQELQPLLLYASPFLLLGMLLEYWHTRHEASYDKRDFLASLGIGLGSLAINGLMKAVLIGTSLFFYALVPWKWPAAWWTWVLTYVGVDLCNYLAHWVAHKQRFWWATHVTHHSSEYLNLSTAFRNSWTQHLKMVFFLPLWLSGAPPLVIFTCYQIDLLYQFWIHTEAIPKLPRWFEYIFVTPSHHRVHHGRNEAYIDKNFGTTFILWDRLFGTFQEEMEKPLYGITKPLASSGIVYLNFHEWADIWRDVRRASGWKEAWNVLWGPPGGDLPEEPLPETADETGRSTFA
ncbi:sterol desaturase family protein [Siphonobacter aquaeclarae]|uniref:Sterol desaturase/sphingolipid hydroxylase, fatty acid hydroxylase superfamily n=1 Tax=Siphonobacter aquaeclarae TaxID=563176 RepID=A0A1G9WBW3_9BACT|nr:sterol desaturase family protein [Siphonobacter aquaeclarae]SDM82064.1 Sterol desaturase/sphingolipid hydroxylase, fatty acid hydroxylase superfamily [Siphonobacter aquaeclarae]